MRANIAAPALAAATERNLRRFTIAASLVCLEGLILSVSNLSVNKGSGEEEFVAAAFKQATLESGRCPPEGGRYMNQTQVLTERRIASESA
jgi:hypothetical protein